MKTLKEAWDWYQHASNSLERMRRLGTHHWDNESARPTRIWNNTDISNDESFKNLTSSQIQSEANDALGPLDDLGILVMFSVFEADVRAALEARVSRERQKLIDPILIAAADEAIKGIQDSSFHSFVLERLKGDVGGDLVERVNQVRHYRNWIAHGKRPTMRRRLPAESLDPKEVFDRLRQFLTALGISWEPELIQTEGAELPEAHELPPSTDTAPRA